MAKATVATQPSFATTSFFAYTTSKVANRQVSPVRAANACERNQQDKILLIEQLCCEVERR